MNIYDEALFHIAEREMPIRDALESLFGHPSQATINHVLRTNEHLGGDWISCGQMLIITPPDCGAFTMLEQQMAIAARHMDMELSKLKPRQRELLAAHYVLLSNLSSYNIARYGWASNRFHHHKKNLERCLNRLDGLLEFGDGEQDLSSRREQLMMQIQQNISSLLRSRLFDQGRGSSLIKARLGLAKGAVVHQWKTQIGPARTIASFKSHYAHVIKGAKSLARFGRVSLALDVAARQTEQLALFESEGPLAQALGCDYGWSLNDSAYHLIIALEGGRSDFLHCSIVAGDDDGLPQSANRKTVFSRSYRKGY